MGKFWIKLFVEMNWDPKIIRLTDKQFRLWVSLLLLAGQIDENGKMGTIKEIESVIRLNKSLVKPLLVELKNYGLIAEKKNQWWIKNWDKRQMPSGDKFRKIESEEKKKIVQKLKALPYSEYLKSKHWLAVRAHAIREYCGCCQLCNSPIDLNVHHRTYERIGEERITDLIVLCGECHTKFHFPKEKKNDE